MSSDKPSLPNTRVELLTDAVIMAYIHAISARHHIARPGGAAAA